MAMIYWARAQGWIALRDAASKAAEENRLPCCCFDARVFPDSAAEEIPSWLQGCRTSVMLWVEALGVWNPPLPNAGVSLTWVQAHRATV